MNEQLAQKINEEDIITHVKSEALETGADGGFL